MRESHGGATFRIGGWNLGFERSTVMLGNEKYLTRWFVMVAGYTVRLHKFHRGDDDRAPHDHPWPFWTFPLRDYVEYVPDGQDSLGFRMRRVIVKAWRWHYRPAEYQHIVLHSVGLVRPFWTIVVTGRKTRPWGFWPWGKFVPWRDWV